MKNVSYIIPLHIYNDEIEVQLKNAIESLKSMYDDKVSSKDKCIIVGPKDVINEAEKLYNSISCKLSLTLVTNDEIDFQTQINKAAMKCITEYFCVLEYDDTFYPYYIDYTKKYFDGDKSNYSLILSVNEYVNKTSNVVSFGNEIGLDATFNENIGYVTLDGLKEYMDFSCTGAFINTEDFIKSGMLKKSMKIASWYEFMLRLATNNKTIYVLPIIGYKHRIDNENGYLMQERSKISQEEGMWLIKTAQEECEYKEDRKLLFENNKK